MMKLISSWKFLSSYRKDPLNHMVRLLQKDQGRSVLNIFGKNIIITSKAEDVNYVLKENANNYIKGRTTQKLQFLLGQGLFTSEGEAWRKQHRFIRPLMNTRGITQLLPKMDEVIQFHFKNYASSQELNMAKEMTVLTWKIVLNTLFSVGPQHPEVSWLHDILDVMEAVTQRTRSLLPIPYWVPTKRHLKMKKTIQQFNAFVFDLMEERKKDPTKQNDLLSLLLNARDSSESKPVQMDSKLIRDEMITFLMAGHETVANSMSWLMILLSQHPEYFAKLREEENQTKDIISFEEKVSKMPLHRAVIDEAQRLYPAIWIFMRQALEDDQMNSVKIKRGTNVVVVPYISHRETKYWDQPEVFRPERFIDSPKPITGSYYPFSLGPRACIGYNFATFESVLILNYLIKNFEWQILHPEEQKSYAGLTLRPLSNIEMRMKRL